MTKKTSKQILILAFIVVILVTQTFSVGFLPVLAQSSDPIPDYISQVNVTNITNVATTLVTQYGPRHEDYNRPFVDASCTLSTTISYPKNNIEMAADYVKGLFETMGYPANAITLELVPQGVGHNVYVTKVGSVYPNVYIEIGAHLDSVMYSPGGSDNASGSSAVIELARVLKDYPSRYSMRFILFAGEEFNDTRNDAYAGSAYHVQQALARGEQIKAGLNVDHIGQDYPGDPTGYMNGISYNNAASERIADLFGQVTTQYGITIGFSKLGNAQNSDQISYWDRGQVAVGSGGGSFFVNDPGYHNCGDTVSNISFTNTLRVAQQNLAVSLKLDEENLSSSGTPTITVVPPTPTNTAGTSLPTNTPVTSTATRTPTGTLVSPGGFPSTAVLDTFDRANGAIGSNWAGTTSGYSIASNRLDVGTGEAAILWQGSSFGPDQEVFVTLTTIDSSGMEQDLLLKSQSATSWNNGLIEVIYDPAGHKVQVWTYSSAQNWVQRGADLPVTFVSGDQFGARAKANGMVEVYRNGTLLGSRDASGWTYATSGGYIGLWFINAGNAVVDDFGGGTVATGPTATPTHTIVPATATNTATRTPSATFTATHTPTTTHTLTFTPTRTFTNTPTATFTATNTHTPTFVPTETFTITPTVVSTITDTPAFTPTDTVTAIPTATFTSTFTPTATHTLIFTPTNTSTNTPTETPTVTNTPTATYTSTFTPTYTFTSAPTDTSTATATFTATNTPVPPTGTYTPTNTASATATSAGSTITIGETSVLSVTYPGLGNRLVAQQVTLSQSATIQSLSYYVATVSGQLRLGIYTNSGSVPGTLIAETAAFTPVAGWNTQPVLTQTLLPAGTYWLAFLPQNNTLAGRVIPAGAGRHYSYTFGVLPATFSSSATTDTFHFSFYATLLTGDVPSNTPTNTTVPPTATSTTTNTPVPPTASFTPTFTPTDISMFTPTATFTSTNTPVPPTATPTYTPTNTTIPPTFTNTPLPITSTGFLAPAANAPQTSSAGDNNGYEGSPSNAYTADGVFATDVNSGTGTSTSCTSIAKDKHLFYNYNFNIPTLTAVNGLEVRLNAKANSASNSPRICVQISWDGGTTWTTAKTTTTLTTTNTAYTLGSPTDTWGRTWVVGNFSNTNFRVRVVDIASSTSRTFSLDSISVNVTYRP